MHFVQRALDHTLSTPQTINWPAGRVRYDNGEEAPPYFDRITSVRVEGVPTLAVWGRSDDLDSAATFDLGFIVLPFDAVIVNGQDGFALVGSAVVDGVAYHVLAHESIFAGA